ncbi:MAG TPA: hypothetical protein VMU46_03055, partial [Burkholderiales bacterium]|nr:hypothetical protein [Burkholderiales bacterium]
MKQSIVFLAFTLAAAASFSAAARDLTLAEAEQLLAERSRELIFARRAVESAGAQRSIAAMRPNATLSLNSSDISNNPGTGPGPANKWRI